MGCLRDQLGFRGGGDVCDFFCMIEGRYGQAEVKMDLYVSGMNLGQDTGSSV